MNEYKCKRFLLKVFYLSPLFLIILMFFLYWNSYSEKLVFPEMNLTIIPYSDKDDNGGHSDIRIISSSAAQIKFSYELKSGFINPYAGVCLYFKKPTDFRKVQELLFELKSSTSESVKIVILTKIPDYTNKLHVSSYLHLQKEIPVSTEFSTVKLKLSDLYTPDWWFENEIREGDRRYQKDLSQVQSLLIQSSTTKKTNIQDSIIIKEIKSISRNSLIIPFFSIILFLDLVALLLFLQIQKTKKRIKNENTGFIDSFSISNFEDSLSQDVSRIVEYIGANYSNADLKLKMVTRACNIQENQISRLLKARFQLSFLQYLNIIRLTEAKRLLLDTDLRISEIAFKTGFSNTPHFIRSFKIKEHLTPGAYRKLNK